MTEKPSKNEEEYFARREAELLEQKRSEAARAQEEAERASHFMKCPKCGADLHTEEYHGIEIDRCGECHGAWFDAGEAESLLNHDDGFIQRIFRNIVDGVSG